ncbi:preprotein translocase subunit SecE [Kribbella sp. ALI-6-A]|uniref:preprotein translocase subunit SecE n=1 Tax=Kribbella sp. ALI-6-A TaxID=1933817 RepID=UPI00097C6195|nr:preprotein translocase subunit SecE [Kribbella sp. ALI-6-A]ONI68669.1 preprotein translocase subunit SecE [Kribbella sp. ALI-6-A]
MTETRTPAPSGAGQPAESKSGNRLLRFYRQVVAELRKVVWPTRKQLSTYFVVVLTFVVFVIAIVSVLDLAFGWAMFKIFG